MDTRPSTYYHPMPNKLINGVFRLLHRFGAAKIELTEAALIAAARKETELHEFGDESFLPALRALLQALREDAHLNPFGQTYAKANTIGSLKNRLWANAAFQANPEIRERKIKAPIIILGPHRSGTTRMQRMMSSDRRLRHLKTWEGINPAPRPGLPDQGRQARHQEVKKALGMADRMYPGAFNGHPMDADWAEEEMLLLNHSFCSFSMLGAYHIPSYYQWFLNADKTFAYRYMADLMKLLSWSAKESEDQRWVLKNPQHLLDLDVLMQTFPDAKLVFLHRDPLKTVASTMSLMWHYTVQHTDLPCRDKVRGVWTDFCEKSAQRSIDMRKSIPAEQQIDVYYSDMNKDWRAVMRRVYEFGEIDFTPDAEQAMDAWLKHSESDKRHGKHRYSLSDFGIISEELDARMMFAREHYGIPYEGKR